MSSRSYFRTGSGYISRIEVRIFFDLILIILYTPNGIITIHERLNSTRCKIILTVLKAILNIDVFKVAESHLSQSLIKSTILTFDITGDIMIKLEQFFDVLNKLDDEELESIYEEFKDFPEELLEAILIIGSINEK